MKDEDYVMVPVPKDRVMEVYRLLSGSPEPDGPEADPEMIVKAYEESPDDTKRFLDLLASREGEWLPIGTIREELQMEENPNQLPGVLSTFPRRWRGSLGQSRTPLPYEREGKASRSRYRMPTSSAQVIASLGNLGDFRGALVDDSDAVAILEDGLAWMRGHGGTEVFGSGRSGPMFFRVPAQDGELVKALSINTSGHVGVQYGHIGRKPPFRDKAELLDLTSRLEGALGISIPPREKAYDVKLDFLRSPEIRAVFFQVFDTVAERLKDPSA